ncbi:MAG: inorganic diphosphatase [Pseudomonadota bacterium]
MGLDRVPSGKDLPNDFNVVAHFFQHYKDLEPGKFVKVQGWVGIEEAKQEIMDGVRAFNEAKDKPAY